MTASGTRSAGIVLVRIRDGAGEVLLVHPGGPFWSRRDAGAWSIPKGEYGADENPQAVALREFAEELGVACPARELIDIGSVRQAGGKLVTAWAACADLDDSTLTGVGAASNRFEIEWPPRSGTRQSFPEVDRAAFFPEPEALVRAVAAQGELIRRAIAAVGVTPQTSS